MDQIEHYLSIMLEELYDHLETIREVRKGQDAQKIEDEIINKFYIHYEKRFKILSVEEIKKRLKEIDKTRRESKNKGDEER